MYNRFAGSESLARFFLVPIPAGNTRPVNKTFEKGRQDTKKPLESFVQERICI